MAVCQLRPLFSDKADFRDRSPGPSVHFAGDNQLDITALSFLELNPLGFPRLGEYRCGDRITKLIQIVGYVELAVFDCSVPATILAGEVMQSAD